KVLNSPDLFNRFLTGVKCDLSAVRVNAQIHNWIHAEINLCRFASRHRYGPSPSTPAEHDVSSIGSPLCECEIEDFLRFEAKEFAGSGSRNGNDEQAALL